MIEKEQKIIENVGDWQSVEIGYSLQKDRLVRGTVNLTLARRVMPMFKKFSCGGLFGFSSALSFVR
jgi:hypothetical protein